MFIKITTRKGCLSFYDFNMRLTNVVYQGEMNCVLNLNFLTQQLINVRYNPRSFPGVIYQNRKIGGNCLIFSNGKINCNGPCESFSQGLKRLRKYARVIQKLGYDVRLQNVRLVTASACHKISGKVNASSLSKSLNFFIRPGVVSRSHVTTRWYSFHLSFARNSPYHRYQEIERFRQRSISNNFRNRDVFIRTISFNVW